MEAYRRDRPNRELGREQRSGEVIMRLLRAGDPQLVNLLAFIQPHLGKHKWLFEEDCLRDDGYVLQEQGGKKVWSLPKEDRDALEVELAKLRERG